MLKKAKLKQRTLTDAQSDLALNFYDQDADHTKGNFEKIARRVLGAKGFGKSKTTPAFKREARKMFDLAR